jgi:amino acid adenylation domain-containing protein
MKRLDKNNIEDILSLTPMQEGMLFHYLEDPESDHYFEQLTLEISGDIDFHLFERAWNFVIETNEMLRTVFRWEKLERPIQIFLKEHKIQPGYYDFSAKGPKQKEKCLEDLKIADRKEKFDLREVPFRLTLCKIAKSRYLLIMSNHHILYDGWSNGIILKEFFKAYQDLSAGKQLVKSVKTGFKDFIKWVNDQDQKKHEKYWRHYLKGFETQTGLSIKRRKGEEINNAGNFRARLTKDSKNKIEDFVKKHKITLASLLYSAWGLLLQRYNNNDDVIFGTTVSGRTANVHGIQEIVGLFINTIPLRIQSLYNEKTGDFLSRVNKTLQIREEYEATSLVNIKAWSEIGAGEELFDSIVILENYPLDSRLMVGNGELSIDSYDMTEATHYDLTVGISILNDIELNIIYNKGIMNKGTVERVFNHFRCIVENMIKNPGKGLVDIEIISEPEKNKLLYEFNDTGVDFPKDKTVHELFEAQAEHVPNKIAVIGKGEALSYSELNRKANQLAHFLRAKGLKPDGIVGIMTTRSIEMMVSIWGIVKAGGAYLPIDPGYPEERIHYMLADSGSKILLTRQDLSKEIEFEQEVIYLADAINRGSTPHLLSFYPAYPANLVYIIYTSGSTGKPRGVMIEHRSIVNRLSWMQRFFPLGEEDVILQKTPFVFDVSVWELFWWAIHGGAVCLLGPGEEKNPEAIIEAIGKNRVTTMHFVPSMLNVFLEYIEFADDLQELRSLRQVFSSGEALRADQVKTFNMLLNKKNGTKLINLYGPTEAAVDVTYFKCFPGENFTIIPIGKPIDNIEIYILDKTLNLQPVHIAGELCISGVGLARGYVNKVELTRERFITNPFTRGKLLYRTGDLSCRLPDGNIEYLGRMDHQVKIRGFRVELVEIESKLMSHKDVKEAVVLIKKDQNNEDYLCGYYVAEKEIAVSDLRAYLTHRLPAYMVPANFIRLERLPLTINGKVDRKGLPEPEGRGPQLDQIYVVPQTDMEKIIADAWTQVLKIDRVGANDNFFDLGGNSLYIIRLSSKLKEVLKREIPVVTLFNHPTVSAQARYFAGKDTRLPPTPGGGVREKEEEPGRATGLEIAVIGMAGRFPGARNIDEFWNNLKEGVESISFFTDEELEALGVDLEFLRNPNYVKAKGVLEGCEYFDSSFFDYKNTEAEVMDPQTRIFHECTWEALENAGYDPHSYNGRIGLYAGATPNLYWEVQSVFSRKSSLSFLEQWEAVQFSNKDYLSTRISYKLNLRGPSVTVQTACSTSLVAIDLACQGLTGAKCDMALAGGVSITFHDEGGYFYQEGMIMSPDGHCRAFDERAEGTVNGNPLNAEAYHHSLGNEICQQMENIDYIFMGVSSGGTITGVSNKIKERFPRAKVIAVDIVGSVIFGHPPRKRYIPGIGSSMVPEILKKAKIDDVMMIDEVSTIDMCHELLKEHYIFAGGSSGSAFAAIKRYFAGKKLKKKVNVVTVFADRGERYADTIYNEKWCREFKKNHPHLEKMGKIRN